MKKRCLLIYGAVLLFVLSGCQPNKPQPITEDTTDILYKEDRYDEVLPVFVYNGNPYTLSDADVVTLPAGNELEEGHFYRLVADVTILNGGVAGYVNYPEVHELKECTEISPFDLDLPSMMEQKYGLCLIGDYADGDLILNDYYHMAVWKDGAWIYHYDRSMKLEDGTLVCCRNDVTEAEVMEGIQKGINSCERYFAYPGNQKNG
ncbi:MAG: hypothetical protein IKG37_06375 [Solobacterium sp.]|nr:hypothetical protein [Solobacterium sp.]